MGLMIWLLSQNLHLVEVFHGLGEAVVDDKANVRLVDAESKRDGGNDCLVLPAEPLAVNLAARLEWHGTRSPATHDLCKQTNTGVT